MAGLQGIAGKNNQRVSRGQVEIAHVGREELHRHAGSDSLGPGGFKHG